jgi:hypothetical protein
MDAVRQFEQLALDYLNLTEGTRDLVVFHGARQDRMRTKREGDDQMSSLRLSLRHSGPMRKAVRRLVPWFLMSAAGLLILAVALSRLLPLQ